VKLIEGDHSTHYKLVFGCAQCTELVNHQDYIDLVVVAARSVQESTEQLEQACQILLARVRALLKKEGHNG
jgi:ribosomal protein L7Ae-like RNA K-turn-binding protein